MTPNLPPTNSQDELDAGLRHLARTTHPRPAFVKTLRARLSAEQAAQAAQAAQPAPTTPLAARLAAALRAGMQRLVFSPFLRSWLGQGALLAALLALVLLAGRLLNPAALTSAGIVPTSTQAPGQPGPVVSNGELPPGAMAALGKGQVRSLDTAADGRLAVGSSAGLCLYGQGMAEEWCRWMPAPVDSVLFSPGGSLLAVHLEGTNAAQIWDARGNWLITRTITIDPGTQRAITQGDLPAGPSLVMAWEPAPTQGAEWSIPLGADYPPGTSHSEGYLTPTPFVTEGSQIPRLAIAGWDGALTLWDIAYDRLDWGPQALPNMPLALDWETGPNGESLLAVLTTHSVSLFDGITGQSKNFLDAQLGDGSHWKSIALSTNGQYLAIGGDQYLRLLTLNSWEVTGTYWTEAMPDAGEVSFSPDSSKLAMSNLRSSGIQILPVSTEGKNPEANFTTNRASPFAWSSQSDLFFVQPDGALARLTGDRVDAYALGYTNPIQGLTWSSAQTILSGNNDNLQTWDAASAALAEIRAINLPGYQLAALAADGSRAAFLADDESAIQLWLVPDNKQLTMLAPNAGASDGAGGAILAAAFSPDLCEIAAAAADGNLYFYTVDSDAVDQREARAPYAAGEAALHVDGLALQPGGEGLLALAYTSADGPHLVVLTRSGEQRATLPVDLSVSALAWSPDGTRLAVAEQLAVNVYDAAAFTLLHHIVPSFEAALAQVSSAPAINRLAFSADNTQLAAGGSSLTVFNLASGQLTHTFPASVPPFTALAFRPDGLALASTAQDQRITLWDLSAPQQPAYPTGDVTATSTPPPYPLLTAPAFTPTPYLPSGTAYPLPGASPTPTPPEIDYSGYDFSQSTFASPTSGWNLEFLRGEWTDRVVDNGESRAADINRFSLYNAELAQRWVIEERPPHGLGESAPARFTWSPENRYLYIDDAARQDGCGGVLYHNLRRIDLATGVEESVPTFEYGQYQVFTLAPNGERIAIVSGAQVDLYTLASSQIEATIPFDPPANPEFGAPLAPVWSPSGQRLAFLISAPYPSCAPERETSLVVVDLGDGSQAPAARRLALPVSTSLLNGWSDEQTLRIVDVQGLEYHFNVDSSPGG